MDLTPRRAGRQTPGDGTIRPTRPGCTHRFHKVNPVTQSNAKSPRPRVGFTLIQQYSVNLNVSIEVFDPKRSNPLPLLTTGLSTSEDKPPFQTWGDSTPQKYVVDGEMQVVPHDRCPRCYGIWDFKFLKRSCPECDATLGEAVKVLLDTDVCPHCEEGKVSVSSPVCPKCGFRVDSTRVVWG